MSTATTLVTSSPDLIAGAYRLDRVLQRDAGSMAVAAIHVKLWMPVVLELAWPSQIEHVLVRRFLDEAHAASTTTSRHLARVVDAGALDDGGFYSATEYTLGEDLAAVVARRGSVSPREAVDWILQTCDAVAALHACGVVHRNLKLSNLRLVATGEVGVVGHARITSLLRAPDADARTDIFALGRMLFELVCGHHAVVDVAALRERGHLPLGLLGIIQRCLHPDAADRYQHVTDLASALRVFMLPVVHREAPRFTAASVVAVPS